MKVRSLVRKVHLYLSMIAGIFIVLIGLTGSLLVFDNELNRMMYPDLYKITEGQPVTYQKALQAVTGAYPKGEIQRVYTPDDPHSQGVYLFNLKEGKGTKSVYVDPGTGNVNGELGEKSFFSQVKEIHYHLLLKDFNGKEIVGIIGFIFFFISLSGLYLWWPGIKKWMFGFVIRRSKNTYVKQYDLHKAIGIVAMPFLLVVSLTGAFFTYDKTVFGWVGAKTSVAPPKDKLISKPLPGGKPPLDSLLSAAEKAVPQGNIMQVRMPAKAKKGKAEGAVEIRLSRPYDPGNGNVKVWIDQYSGKVLAKLDPKMDDGLTYQTWLKPLHTGTFGGVFTKILYVIAGLTPSILMFTGTYMWWHKKKKKRGLKDSSVTAA
ncbi:PepSY domain-containing protein [Bacillus cytotoxicus]|uniref:PepSY domain-containing protein n=1 Tax=Bacillus cytotoxicus TaxID=580165 RepID=A0ACC6A1Z6_9BACI|nr:PepSY domain-containing protein [Bacillus cytotoxicus]